MKPSEDPADLKRLSRGWSNDMSAPAVQLRLVKVSKLYRAWKLLNTKRKLHSACRAASPDQPPSDSLHDA